MSDETITVRITLRKHVAERLRRMCHTRGETASFLIDRWIFEHDDRGEPIPKTTPRSPLDDLFGGPFGGGPFGGRSK